MNCSIISFFDLVVSVSLIVVNSFGKHVDTNVGVANVVSVTAIMEIIGRITVVKKLVQDKLRYSKIVTLMTVILGNNFVSSL